MSSGAVATALIVACAAGGVLVGAAIPQLAYRLSVDYTEQPRSSCTRCARPCSPGVTGWVRWGSRCAGCAARLGPPAWLTALVTGAACALLGWVLSAAPSAVLSAPALLAYLLVVPIGVLLAAIDLACLRLPDPLVALAGALALGLFGLDALLAGSAGALVRGLLAAAALSGLYLVLALLPGGSIGFGDVKLALVLGLLLGWLGWGAVLLGVLLPHLINGPVALVLLLTRRVGARTELPLGPALLGGTLAAVVIFALARW